MKYMILFVLMILNFNLSHASTSMPDLPYGKGVKVGDCFAPKNGEFPMIMKIEEILPKEKKYKATMLVEMERGKYYGHPMGNYPWSEKKSAWDQWLSVKCPGK